MNHSRTGGVRRLSFLWKVLAESSVALALLFSIGTSAGQSSTGLWEEISGSSPQAVNSNPVWIQPDIFRSFKLNHSVLHSVLAAAPKEEIRLVAFSDSVVALPMPDGSTRKFRFVESPLMAPELAAQFPEIKTYVGQGLDDPLATVRFDLTPAGFHAQILSPEGAVYIDPFYRGDTNTYTCYYKRDYSRAAKDFLCLAPNIAKTGMTPSAMLIPQALTGSNLRTYRLACAATGEYTQFHGGTVSAGMSAIVTAINRVTGVYETELAIRLVLVANNQLLVYTNAASDPYNNTSPSSLLSQNQSNIDFVIGSANYDIGHVFSTAGGGLAGLGVVCVAGSKARGETGTASPVGDPFYIDYVAHEMGHQFGANHSFNSSTSNCGGGNRNAATAYEVGSGSTIMAYAGICGADDLQPHSDPYFHSVSLDEITAYTTSGAGSGCPVVTASGNGLPVVNAGGSYVIPKGTPFTLTASGSDPNGDTLTYCWEERDLGPSVTVGTADNGASPLFRSFSPTLGPSRTFPAYSNVLNNTVMSGEGFPAVSRTMQFRVVARDNKAGGGGVSYSDTSVTVNAGAGPFVVTAPNSAVTWSNVQTVTWNVAGTTASPINATNVNILLSTNGGATFPIMLAANKPNTGSQNVMLPNISCAQARIRVEAVGNIFFDISNTNFSIVPATLSPAPVLDTMILLSENCAAGNGVIDPGETVTFNVGFKNLGQVDSTNLVVTLLSTNGVISPSAPQAYGSVAANGATVSRSFSFTAGGGCGGSITPTFVLQDASGPLGNGSRTFTLGTMISTNVVVTNSSAIAILDNAAASPYPSAIVLSGITGTVTKVTATLRGLSHTYPDDIDILLVGPNGQNVLLMSDTGDSSTVTNLTLTFDDAAASSLPDASLITSGTYKPTNFDTNTDNFPSPVPTGPFGNSLSVFNGLNPNGAWMLYVQDDAAVDVGTIARGWSLSLTVARPSCCTGIPPSADLVISETATPSLVNAGGTVTFGASVTNTGPNDATFVSVTNLLPASLSFGSANASQGSWAVSNGVITFALGTVTNGGTAVLSVTGVANAAGILSSGFTVASAVADPFPGNNHSVASIAVNSTPTISAIPNQTVNANQSTAAVGFSVGDAETPPGSLTLSAASSNSALCPVSNIIFGGSGGGRTVSLTPASNASGTSQITVFVSDGNAVASATFQFSVHPLNHAPVLAPIADQTVMELTLLLITNQVTDPDLPANILTFRLETNAPPGALINPTNGIVSWTPTAAQAPSTNLLTVVVSDDGSPSLSATQSFTVTVLESNLPPVLLAIPDKIVLQGQTLIVTNVALDAHSPPRPLLFNLDASPAGANINPTNGVLTFATGDGDANTTNLVTVRVTDNGAPPLSDVKQFRVIVVAPPLLELAVSTNNTINLRWNSIAGQTYRVQFRDSMAETNWQSLTPDVTASGSTAIQADANPSPTQRFYRLLVVP
jgi:uncharacterized repeat protein (TIGR01451 family)